LYDVGLPLLRSWLYGIGAFIAVTAAVAIGFVIAITGPPNAAEVEEFAAILAGDSDNEAGDVSDESNDIPEFAPGGVITIQASPPSPEVDEFAEAETAPSLSASANDATEAARTELAGPRSREEALAAARRVEQPRPGRTERARAERSQAAASATAGRRAESASPTRQRTQPSGSPPARRPITVAGSAHAPLPNAVGARALEDLFESAVPEILSDAPADPDREAYEDVWPTQSEAPPAREYEEAGYPDDGEAYEEYDDTSWYGSEEYQEEVERRRAEREARRRYREERRRAYREWRRRYEGW
jgi:hypothetical protein